MDFKVKCVAYNQYDMEAFTIGKVYSVIDGKITNDRGFTYDLRGNGEVTFDTLYTWFKRWYEFEEVKEENGMKFKIGDRVKVVKVRSDACRGRKNHAGDIFTIEKDGQYGICGEYYEFSGCPYIFYADELELVEKHEDPLERIKETFAKFKGVSDTKNLVTVKNVIFNPPATIIHWSDNTKSVVKCQNDEPFDAEKGFVMAYLKKLLGNDNTFNKEITKWVTYEPPVEKVEKVVEDTKDWKIEDYMVSKHNYKFKVGDKVKVTGSADTFTTSIDGKIGTLTELANTGCYKYFVSCDDGLTWGVKEDQLTLVEDNHKFTVGDKVRGHGSASDFNDGLDDQVGTIVRINPDRRLKYCIEYEPYFYLYFAEDQLELVEEEVKPIKKDRYEPGDKVKIIDHRGKFWNHEGKMDEYCDKVLTVKARSGFSDSIYTMEECPRWAFDYYDIVGVVEDSPKEEPKSEYYNGKVVCTDNKYKDFYHIDEFTIGKVYDVVDGRIKGDSGWSYYEKAKSLDKLCAWMGTTFIPIKE